jgi:hypothetical protein
MPAPARTKMFFLLEISLIKEANVSSADMIPMPESTCRMCLLYHLYHLYHYLERSLEIDGLGSLIFVLSGKVLTCLFKESYFSCKVKESLTAPRLLLALLI